MKVNMNESCGRDTENSNINTSSTINSTNNSNSRSNNSNIDSANFCSNSDNRNNNNSSNRNSNNSNDNSSKVDGMNCNKGDRNSNNNYLDGTDNISKINNSNVNSNVLEINNLDYFIEEFHILKNISLKINKGEFIGLIGPNGAGKTTLFNVIAGTYIPSAGSIKFNGEEIANLSSSAVANKGIIRTFQITSLFGGCSVLESLMIAQHINLKANFLDVLLNNKKVRREEADALERCEEILKLIGLEEKSKLISENLSYGDQRL